MDAGSIIQVAGEGGGVNISHILMLLHCVYHLQFLVVSSHLLQEIVAGARRLDHTCGCGSIVHHQWLGGYPTQYKHCASPATLHIRTVI